MNISSYGPRGDGAEIAYAIVDSALGRLLLAGTERGICFAAMGEADRTLIAELRGDYPRATIRVADPIAAMTRASAVGPMRSPNTSRAARRCRRRRWIFAGLPFSLRYGTNSARFPPVKLARTPKSRDESDGRAQSAPSAPPTAPIQYRLSSHVIAQFARRAIWAAIDGASSASESCSRWKPGRNEVRSSSGHPLNRGGPTREDPVRDLFQCR